MARGQRRKDWDTAGRGLLEPPVPTVPRGGDCEYERVSGSEEGMFSISVGLFLALLLQSLWKLHVPGSVQKHDEFFKGDVQLTSRPGSCRHHWQGVCVSARLSPPHLLLSRPGPPFSWSCIQGRCVPCSVIGRQNKEL